MFRQRHHFGIHWSPGATEHLFRRFFTSNAYRILVIKAANFIKISAMLAVTGGCLAYAVAGINWGKLQESFAEANYLLLAPMTLILISFYALKAWRWSLLLRPVKQLTSWQVTPAMMIGFMANNLLPAHLGEFVRVYVLGLQFDLKKTPVLSTVVLERVFDILAILLLLGISLFFVEGMPEKLQWFCQIFGGLSLAGVIALLIYMAFTRQFVAMVAAIFSWMPFLPGKVTSTILEMLETAAVGLESIKRPALLGGIALSSLAQWLLNGLMIYCSAVAFDIPINYFDALMVMGVIVFAILMPAPPGYFGVIQACFALVLVPRFAQEPVVGSSIFYQMSQFIPVTVTGLIFMNRMGLSLGGLQQAKTDDSPSGGTSGSEDDSNRDPYEAPSNS